MMKEAIINFPKQFKWKPKVEGGKIKKYKRFVVCGMGGSHLGAGLLKTLLPDLDIVIHRSYGLPNLTEDSWKKRLVIASSYSGNTEETIEAFEAARAKKIPLAIIAAGGKLIELAKLHQIPFVQMPNTGIQPRSALGFQLRGIAKLMKLSEELKKSEALSKLNPESLEAKGRDLANLFKDKVPVIYASQSNRQIAYNWKIKFNETGKIPAFTNIFPELNHNEMTGFDVKESSRHLSEKFHFIFIKSSYDHPRILKRIEILEKLYKARGLEVTFVPMEGESLYYKIFNSLILADWTALYTAELYGLESEQVPMVEEFKSLIA